MKQPVPFRQITAIALALISVSGCIYGGSQMRQALLNRQLIAAIRSSDAGSVEGLLARGANPNSQEIRERTFLQRLQDLIHPPKENAIRSALFIALTCKSDRIEKALIAAHADINVKDGEGNTALFYAVNNGWPECVDALIAAHADVNTRNSSGRTPLIWAVITDEPGALNALILAHADVNLKDVAGETALSSAKQYNHSAIETLRLAGARE